MAVVNGDLQTVSWLSNCNSDFTSGNMALEQISSLHSLHSIQNDNDDSTQTSTNQQYE